ncbi:MULTISPECIES: ferredoxin [Gracilibacillus]|uniref:Ferredoxin n=1 Tax=Gracilibacillus dipsosauri TaxID=178340 RepID=A0A317L157_9BACI|nr:ferredoxin [Gracilibacillus dipsosauri]PWU69557.1 ferredoxin [Gracilibacillus dipsosauri]
MPTYAVVDKETCIGCGNCEGIAPDVFDFDDEGLAFVKLDNNQGKKQIPTDHMEDLIEATGLCPTDSVKLSELPFNQK